MKWTPLNTENDTLLPELRDEKVLVRFENGKWDAVYIIDMFDDIYDGLDEKGQPQYTKLYRTHIPKITHWRELSDSTEKVEICIEILKK